MAILTQNYVTTFTLGKRDEAVVRDQRLAGFCLRVRRRADGKLSRTYFVTQEVPPSAGGKRRRERVTIGDTAMFTADEAREEARKMLQAAKLGDDMRAARLAKAEAKRWEDLVTAFDRDHITHKSKGTQADYRGRIARHLTLQFKGQRVADIRRSDIAAWHQDRGDEHPTDANRNLAILSAMMKFAIAKGWRETNPCAGIARYTEKVSEAWLDERDLPPFLAALAKVATPYGDLVRYLAVTGWRISEARLLRWEMVDLDRGVAALPQTKTGAQDRHLSADAVTILTGIGHRAGYVFSKKRGLLPLDYRETREVLRAVCRDAGIREITPHALRRTAATWTAKAGGTAYELKQAFGWKSMAMADRYVKRAESLARQGVERAASAMNVLGNK